MHEIVDFIPVIWREPLEPRTGRSNLAIWLNGFTGAKEDVAPFLEQLAAAGYVAVSFDLYQHGERLMEPQEVMVRRVGGNRRKYFWEVLGRTAEDFPRVIDWAFARFGNFGGVAVGGVSMGGDIALTAALVDRRIQGVCCMIATPEWMRTGAEEAQGEPDSYTAGLYERLNPATHLERYAERKPFIHFENAEKDPCVPPAAARRFMEELRVLYGEDAGKLTLREEPDLYHTATPGMWKNCHTWFQRAMEHG
ncbi:dienelactone hydrolase family protein [Cohnella silvisoli]|uniref:Dienelactone hydrolase family protein n=1 Tax=Cohnella silvisoli TaxID=2873699 RepID=A0ABV1KX75_9BACL|nr:dienelactone hydrolase family protein [Cohnella silvisoli]MCD9024107.1 dienelactone hydrolase family protein [Cohnella silvisoli]